MKWLLIIAAILIVGIFISHKYEVVWVPDCPDCKANDEVHHERVANSFGSELHRWKCQRCKKWL